MNDSLEIVDEENPIALGDVKQKVFHGSLWAIGGHATEQVFRLGSNLILTRLLIPEYFGIMALVNIFLQGIQMFSDIGLQASVIRSPRGSESLFLNTIWTLRILRGFGLLGLSCLLAWPISQFYNIPILAKLIPVAGCVGLVEGFKSTKWDWNIRTSNISAITTMEILSKFLGLSILILLAYLYPSIWVLMIGSLTISAIKVFLSHSVLPGPKNALYFDRTAWLEIFQFGKWIFSSTALTFLWKQTDRLVLGKIISISLLGVYSIAFMIFQAMCGSASAVSMRVLFPIYSKMALNNDNHLAKKVNLLRAGILACILPPICFVAIFGNSLIMFLYDPRYFDAGWILEYLAVGAIASTINLTIRPLLLAQGDSFRFMILNFIGIVITITSMFIGYQLLQLEGLILGISISYFLTYPVILILVSRYHLLSLWLDLTAITLSLGSIYLIKRSLFV